MLLLFETVVKLIFSLLSQMLRVRLATCQEPRSRSPSGWATSTAASTPSSTRARRGSCDAPSGRRCAARAASPSPSPRTPPQDHVAPRDAGPAPRTSAGGRQSSTPPAAESLLLFHQCTLTLYKCNYQKPHLCPVFNFPSLINPAIRKDCKKNLYDVPFTSVCLSHQSIEYEL